MVRRLSLALLILLVVTIAASAQVVIDEIVYNPVGDEASGEWVELYNAGANSVDLSGWQLTDQDGNTYTFPSASIAAGGFVVIHTGAGTDTSTNLYWGKSTAVWNNTGDEVLLEDDTSAGIDYIQYDGGSGDSPPGDLTWSGNIPGTSEGNSLALIPYGNDQDSATNWIPRSGSYITPGSANAPQPDPTVTVDITYPTGKDYVSTCEQAQATITVTNNDPAASIYDTQVTATLPSDFYYVSDDQGGTYNAGNHTITWSPGEITAGGSWQANITFKPSCSALTNQTIAADVGWASYPGGGSNTVPTVYSDPIDVEPVALGITKLVYNDTAGQTEADADTTTQAARGDQVVFVIQITNNGDGDAVDGAEIGDVLGGGLSLVSLTDEGGSAVSYTGSGTSADPYTWSTGEIDHAAAKKYYLEATVIGCEDLVNDVSYTWGCADQGGAPTCESTGYASSSISLILKEPDISYTVSPNPIMINYCSGGTVTVNVTNGDPNSPNPDVGTAHAFSLTMDGLPADYQVTNVSGATYNSGEFSVGDIDPNTEVSFSFVLSVKSGVCSPAGSGTLLFTPNYTNDCGKGYFPPVTIASFGLTGRPSISIAKTGQRAVDVGETDISYTLTVHYEGPDNQTLTIVDDYPDASDTANGWGNFTVADPAGGTDDGDKITWTHTFNNNEDWSATIKLNAPTNACAGGNTYTNTLSIDPTVIYDCNNCTIPITDNGSFGIYVNNNTEKAVTDHDKTVTYLNVNSNGVHTSAASAEDCTDIQYTTSVTFNTGTAAPQTWSGIVFRDDMDNAQTYVSLDAVTVDGTDYTANVAVTNTSPYLEVDFSGLDSTSAPAPNSGTTLAITYTFHAPDGSEGSFIDWSHLTIPGFGTTCTESETYNQGVDVSIDESSLGVSLSGPQIIDKCGTYTYTITVSKGDFQGYDALVTFDTNGNYTYVPDSTVFSGFTDEGGTGIGSFEPTVNGNELTWDLGDLSTAGTIQISLTKCCSPTDTSYSASVEYNDNCHNQTDGSVTSWSGSSTTSGAANYLAQGQLRIDIEPSSYFVVDGYPQFKVYLLNTGDGAAYNADLTLTFNGQFVYRSYTSSEVAPTSFTGSSGDTSVTWHYDEIPAGQKSVLTVTGELTGCDTASVDGSATWGCCSQGTDCQTDLPVTDTMTLQSPGSDMVVVQHTMTPNVVDYCGDPVSFTITAKNYGPALAYHPWLQETLADGLSYVSGTAEYSLDGGSTWSSFPGEYTSYSGQVLKWNFVDPNNDGDTSDHLLSTTDGHGNYVLASGETISIRFQAHIADCTAATTFESGNHYSDAHAYYDLPCAHTNADDPLSASPISRLDITGADPHIKVTVWGKNTTAVTSYTTGTVNGESGDTIVWKVQIQNDGDYRAKEISLQDVLPSNVTYSSWSQVAAESDEDLAFDSGDGTSGNPLTWHVDNSDQGLDVGQVSTIEITTTVNACTTTTTNTATATWGCCSADQGSESDSVDLKTQLATSDLAITVNPQNFSTCGGDVTIQVTNNDQFHTAYHFHLKDTLPTSSGTYAWVYDPSSGGAEITSSDGSHTFTQAEEEPVLSSNDTVLEWMDETGGGNVTNGNAYIAPGETLTITFHVKASGNYCDTDFANDPDDPDVGTIPTDDNLVDLSYQDSCGNTLSVPQVANSVDPVQPDVDIVSVVSTPPLASTGDTVHWTITLRNDGDGTAENVSLESVFGSGFDNTSVTNITPAGSWTSGTDTVTWSSITLSPGESATYEYDVTISGTGSLTNTATVTGECLDASGTVVCNHSYDQLIGQAAGVDFDKSITNIPAPGTIASDGNSGDATIGNVITYEIHVHYLGDGTYENTTITDELPSGLELVDQSSTTTPTVDVAFTQNANVLTWTLGTGTPPSFTNAVDATITVRARVKDDPVNVWNPATTLTNTAYTDFTWNGTSYVHTDPNYAAKISEQNTITVIEPWIADDSDYTKTSIPSCDTPDHQGTPVAANDTIDYTFTARNTGTSPAYDLVFVDTIPVGMRGTVPSVTSVTVTNDTLGTRSLTSATDYVTTWDSGTGTLTVTLQNTTDAALQPGELLTIDYQATVDTGVGSGSYLDNAAQVDSYTSLPGDGSITAENGHERTYGYTVGSGNYGYVPELICQHHTEPLPGNTKTVSAQITPPIGEQTAGNAQVGEPITYKISITVPAGTTAYDMLFSDTAPDGLTVTGVTCDVDGTPTGTPTYSENGDGTTDVSVPDIGDVTGGSTVLVTIDGTVDQVFTSANTGDANGNGIVDRDDVLWNGASYSWNTVDNDENTRVTVDSNEVSTTIQEPELALSKTSDDADRVIEQGQTVTYTITLSNTDSDGVAYDPVVTDVVPQELRDPTVDSVTLNGTTTSDYDYTYNTSTGEMEFSLTHSGSNAIDPNSDLVIVYHVTVPAGIGAGRTGSRALINDANAVSYSLPTGTNDPGRREYSVGPVQVPLTTPVAAVTKDQSPADGSAVNSGDTITYTLRVPDPTIQATLYDVSVVDTVPDGLSVTDVTLSGGQTPSYTVSGRTVTATFGKIAPGTQATVTITCSVNATFDSGSAISPGHAFTNQARLDWYDASASDPDRRDHVTVSNTTTAYFQGAAIILTPDHTSETFPGSMVTYRHTLENLGSEDDTVTLSYGPSSQSWSWLLYFGDGNGNITGAPIASGSQLTIAAGARQELIMRAFAPADTPDGTTDVVSLTADGTNNSDSVTDITLVHQGKMALVKEESKDDGATWHEYVQAQPEDSVIFRLTFKNIGTIPLKNIRVIDSIPDNTVYVADSAASGNDGTYNIDYSTDGGVNWTTTQPPADAVTHVRWTYTDNSGNLAPGESHYVSYEVKVK